jgi:Flp pilus assembly protein CpaB
LRLGDRVDVVETDTQARETTIVVATRDLPQGLLIKNDALAVEKISISSAPENFIADPMLAVGKVLKETIVKSQPVLTSSFAEGSGLRLAANLPPGMRAVGVSLGGSSGLQGLLYAGCYVDVLATTKGGRGSGPSSRILLERVLVLEIGDQTSNSSAKGRGSSVRTSRRNERVVLMLDARQAGILQSAAASGTISLVMRHPLEEVAARIEEEPEEQPAIQQPEPEAEEFDTEEINGGARVKVTYIKRGGTWQRKEE